MANNMLYAKKENIGFLSELGIYDNNFFIIAGPCSVETREQLLDIANFVNNAGASILRGGAYKPRTSPYSFRGLGRKALEYLLEAKKLTGLPVVTEVMNVSEIEYMYDYIDVFQVGSRNMYNYDLLEALGRQDKPVLLKRGLSATIDEFLLSAEYILLKGNKKVILCERGIRTFENITRNTLDISAVPVLKEKTYLPVVVDPSHATGNKNYVIPLSLAAIASGADGIMVEVHNEPEKALSDGKQSLDFDMFRKLISLIRETFAKKII